MSDKGSKSPRGKTGPKSPRGEEPRSSSKRDRDDKDRDRHGKRDRDRDRDDDRDKDRDRHGKRDRDREDRERDRDRDRDREGKHHRHEKRREKKKEVDDDSNGGSDVEDNKPAEKKEQAAEEPQELSGGAEGAKILVLFYSTYGHVYKLAQEVAKGAKNAGAEVRLRRVPETLPNEVLEKMGALEAQKAFADVEAIHPDDIVWADGVLWGSPTRFGNVTAQMKAFMDRLGGLWASNACDGKVASAFTSSATQHGGQESTLVAGFFPFFLHLGFVISGLPYSFKGLFGLELMGGSPYGASTIAGGQGQRQASAVELSGCRYQGGHVARIAAKVAKKD